MRLVSLNAENVGEQSRDSKFSKTLYLKKYKGVDLSDSFNWDE